MQWLALMMITTGAYLADCAVVNRPPIAFIQLLIADPSNIIVKWQASKGTWIAPVASLESAITEVEGTDDTDAPTGTDTTYGWHPNLPNGKLSNADLVRIPFASAYRVYKTALPSLVEMNKAYRKEFGRDLVITSAYRDWIQQAGVKAAKPGLAAEAGKSYHGWGVAIDFGGGINRWGTKEHDWMVTNAGKFGWFLPSWAQQNGSKPEPWHWQFNGAGGGK